MTRFSQTRLALGAVVLLSACADNEITVSVPTPSLAFPVAAVVSAYVQTPHDHVLTATSGADTYTLTWHSVAGPAASFEGTAAATMDYTNTITKNGVAVAGASLTDYFALAPFKPLGGQNHTQGSYEVASAQQPLPATAQPGQSGAFGLSTKYTSATKQTVIATGTSTWSLEAESASAAWACINVSIKYANTAQPDGYESVCHKTDVSGALLGVRMTLDLNGLRLTFK